MLKRTRDPLLPTPLLLRLASANDASVALVGAVALFLIPSGVAFSTSIFAIRTMAKEGVAINFFGSS